MLFNQPIQLRDALAFKAVLGEALEAAGGPEGFAFGFEPLELEVGHQLGSVRGRGPEGGSMW